MMGHAFPQSGSSTMTILIVQGPHSDGRAVGGDVVATLQRMVQAAGHKLAVFSCRGLRELIGCIRSLPRGDTEFIVFDPGEWAGQVRGRAQAHLHEALDALPTQYVEIHDDSAAAMISPGSPRHPPLATIVIHGDLPASYRIAMGIALRQLAI